MKDNDNNHNDYNNYDDNNHDDCLERSEGPTFRTYCKVKSQSHGDFSSVTEITFLIHILI